MNWFEKALLFYGIAGVIFGGFAATSEHMQFTYGGRPVRYPRLGAFVFCLLLWPVPFASLMFGPLR